MYFATEWMFKKFQRVPFTFFGTMRLTGDFKNIPENFFDSGTVEECFEVFLLFMSLRYGADLGRSRVVLFHLVYYILGCSKN